MELSRGRVSALPGAGAAEDDGWRVDGGARQPGRKAELPEVLAIMTAETGKGEGPDASLLKDQGC